MAGTQIAGADSKKRKKKSFLMLLHADLLIRKLDERWRKVIFNTFTSRNFASSKKQTKGGSYKEQVEKHYII